MGQGLNQQWNKYILLYIISVENQIAGTKWRRWVCTVKMDFKMGWEGVGWIHMARNTAFVITIMNLLFYCSSGLHERNSLLLSA